MEDVKRWVQRAKHGDAQAFGKLYEQVYKDMYHFALYTLQNEQDAEDAVSDTVVSAYTGIASLRREEAFRSWIFRILYFRCQDRLRDMIRRREREHSLDAEEMDLPQSSAGPEQSAVVRELLFSLPQEERTIIGLHIYGGYGSREIAEMLHMNAATVRSKESRAFAKLRKEGGFI